MSEAPHGPRLKPQDSSSPRSSPGLLCRSSSSFCWLTTSNNSTRTGAGTGPVSPKPKSPPASKPLAQVDVRDANAPRVYKTGEEVYKAVCSACHASGAAGAPKFTNTARLGAAHLAGLRHAAAYARSPAKAECPRAAARVPTITATSKIARAVAYMANNSGASFAEPAQPASGAAAAPVDGCDRGFRCGGRPARAGAGAARGSRRDGGDGKRPATAAAPAAGATQSADASQAGKALYQQVCQCMSRGRRAQRTEVRRQGSAGRRACKEPMDTVYNYALHGKGAMPPKGGSSTSDADVKAAVDYMVSSVK